jgi:hypothetical protein
MFAFFGCGLFCGLFVPISFVLAASFRFAVAGPVSIVFLMAWPHCVQGKSFFTCFAVLGQLIFKFLAFVMLLGSSPWPVSLALPILVVRDGVGGCTFVV